MPLLPGQNAGREVNPVDVNKLNEIGIQVGAFALHKDDVIKFPEGQPLVVSQKVRNEANSPLAYYVGVERNGKPSWLGIGILTRRDHTGTPIGDFQKKMCEKASFKEIYEELAGKAIKGGELKEVKMAVFRDGQRTDDVRSTYVPEIIWN
jgi:hypothetical protein